ncbi:uncharacterized protein PFL1_02943 [Pseudozyma flocculosa PF-1]|uniref:Triosephosphate isomerase n=2 Tax=Pseudozyma flocculosa TaxID=84751 RepID=A0A5C3F4Z6_9BASI|nr:uncharacterized protein PFL1_02943 [Pseudozyma flocculosa PF-1]EPQ29723.1 hypothetical protein PFL1_02943 [Pseudozyma flocculosa PF-1]SPO38301.1 related to triose-phosphate isomerase [Pseudozyma flocculosa]
MSSNTAAATATAASPARKPLVGVSFKMYFDLPKTQAYINHTLSLLASALPTLQRQTDVFVIPDFVTLTTTKALIDAASPPQGPPLLDLGAQDVHSTDFGAYTGEVSPVVLSQVGVRFVEIGHAERRRLFGETDDDVAKKASVITANAMVPLVCIGEVSRPDNEASISDQDLERTVIAEVWTQIRPVLESIRDQDDVVFAYEPVWAIGAAQPAPADYVVKVTQAIRRRYNREYAGRRSDQSMRILYGGSAGPGLFEKLKDGVEGLFLGRFAHKPEAFVETIKEIAGVKADA